MAKQPGMQNQTSGPMPSQADMAATETTGPSPAPPAPPAPQVAGEPTMINPLEGLPPAAQQHIMLLTRQVADIIAVMQQFIPAVIQRISEMEAQMGLEGEAEGEMGAEQGPPMAGPPQAPTV